ncbi:uracil-DNA glycosylase [Candidatus Gracilibacteria bacterium]|nr:uracil-DNA glycosylase [Candidatus Gracilibacteria bacterium]MCF7897115.1 uracil-DNA glycosylase [Candidatus Gracilibacteria bacterium]
MNFEEKQTALSEIAKKIELCRNCKLCEQRTKTVPGSGSPDAEVFFIGEGPGKSEDLQGLPFVGAAGKFLDQMLESINWSRENIFIGNVVKCRPPGNRDPEPDEVEKCWDFLQRQIEIIAPKLIVTLGRHSMNRFLPGLKISTAHGQPKRRKDGQVFLPLYHPAAALYSPSSREIHLRDFAKIPVILKKIG